ncbi:MAG: helix-turn-helix domain-containing protein [Candidatus Rokuibacteriota bacterium]
MPRPLARQTQAALKLVAKGTPPYRAALRCGVSPSTVYRALARGRKKPGSQ